MGDVGDGDRDHEAAGIVGIVVAHGVHGVVVVLGVRRIDGDERQRAPVLAAGKPRRLCRFRFRDCCGGKDVRDRMGVNSDQADRALAHKRAEPFRHARAGESIAASPCRDLDRHQVAVARVAAGARRDRKLAAELFLVDRRKAAAAARRRAENAEHALPATIDELDDPPAVADRIVLLAALLDPQQRAIADAGNLARPRAARNAHANPRSGAVFGLVPFARQRDQLAVGIARGDVAEHDVGQTAGVMQLLAPAFDQARVGKLAQHALEDRAVGILQAEGARDLAGADLTGCLADEGEQVVFGGK